MISNNLSHFNSFIHEEPSLIQILTDVQDFWLELRSHLAKPIPSLNVDICNYDYIGRDIGLCISVELKRPKGTFDEYNHFLYYRRPVLEVNEETHELRWCLQAHYEASQDKLLIKNWPNFRKIYLEGPLTPLCCYEIQGIEYYTEKSTRGEDILADLYATQCRLNLVNEEFVTKFQAFNTLLKEEMLESSKE